MSMRDLSRRIKYLWHRKELAGELDEELRLQLELRAKRLREQGMDAEAARHAARRQFGNRAAVEIASSEVWGWAAWDRLGQDVQYALRALRKTPGFTAVVVATLAVGLGMNTAVFSIVNAVMLRSLPYRQPDRLVSLWEEVTKPGEIVNHNSSGRNLGGAGSHQRTTVSAANLADHRQVTNAFEELAGVETAQMNLTGDGSPERLTGERVTAGYLSTLGVAPAVGRTFTAEEDRPGSDAVAMVSHDFWQRLGGDTAVLGRTVMLDARPYRVIGVMPGGFQAATQFGQTAPVEFFVPAAYSKELLASRGDHDINVVGRLQTGVSWRAAQERLDAVSAALEKQYPDSNLGIRARIAPLRDDLVQNVKDSLGALWGASALIVLITCVNVANLLLVRAVGRRHETNQLLFQRWNQRAVFVPAIQIRACLHGACGGRRHALHRVVALEDIADRAAIGDHVSRKAPLLAQNIAEQSRAGAGRLAVHLVIGAHHRVRPALANRRLEMRQVALRQVRILHLGVEAVARRFGSGVHREVLGGGHHFQILRVVALQSLDEVDRQAPRQVRVFAVGLHASAPARVAHQVDVGRPEGEALVHAPLAAPLELVVLGGSLVGDRRGHAENESGIPSGSQADGLREHRGAAGGGHAVEAFAPPVVGRDGEPLDGRRLIHHLRDLLGDGQAREQVVHALCQRRIGVLVERGRLAPGSEGREQGSPK